MTPSGPTTPAIPATPATPATGGRADARHWRRLFQVLVADAFRAAPGWMAAVLAMTILSSLAAIASPVAYRWVVTGIERQQGAVVISAVVASSVVIAVSWISSAVATADATGLADRMTTLRMAHVVRVVSRVPTLADVEEPAYLDTLNSQEANRAHLAGAPRQVALLLGSAVRTVAVLVLLVEVSPWSGLLALAAIPPSLASALSVRVTRRAEDAVAEPRRRADLWFDLATDASQAGEIRCFGLGSYVRDSHARLQHQVHRRLRRSALTVLALQTVGWLGFAAVTTGVVVFLLDEAARGIVTVGAFFMVLTLIQRARREITASAQVNGAMLQARVAADRLISLESYVDAALDTSGDRAAPAELRHGIDLRGVSFAYGEVGDPALDRIDLEVRAGEVVALVGTNGSGKTTLVKLLLGLYTPTSGTITVDGVDLADLDLESWRDRCTATFQDFSKFQLRALESIGVADLPRLGEREPARQAAVDAGADPLLRSLPEGLDTELGSDYTGGHGLSDGQWQKLAVARMLRRREPLVAVIDEPSANMDPLSEAELFRRSSRVSAEGARQRNMITVLVSHRLTSVRHADLIVVLDHGRIVERGDHATLIAHGGVYARMYSTQARGILGADAVGAVPDAGGAARGMPGAVASFRHR